MINFADPSRLYVEWKFTKSTGMINFADSIRL
jgi:hypothetical protein